MASLEDAAQAAQGLGLLALLPSAVALAGAAACALAARRAAPWIAIAAAGASLAAAALLLVRVLRDGPSSAPAGGWAWPWSGEHHVDAAAGLVLVVATAVSALGIWVAARAAEPGERAPRALELDLVVLAALARAVVSGSLAIAIAFLLLALFLAHAPARPTVPPRAARARRWLCGLSAGSLALGALCVYAATDALDLVEVRVRAADVDPLLVQAGFWLLAIGTCLTLALALLDLGLARSADAPRTLARMLQAAAIAKVAVLFVPRFSLGAFGEKFTLQHQPFELLVLAVALALIGGGVLLALFQRELHRLLCWVSVAQVGGLLLGLGMGNIDGLTGSLTALAGLAAAECTLLLAAGAFATRGRSLELRALAGIGRSMPCTLGAFAVAALGLAGAPLTVGFVAKWYLVLGALQSGLWPLATLTIAVALGALVALGRVIEVALGEPLLAPAGLAPAGPALAGPAAETPLALLVPMWLAALASIALGTATAASAGIAARAAGALLEVAL